MIRLSMFRLITVASVLLISSLLPGYCQASPRSGPLSGQLRAELAASQRVTPALMEALESQERVVAKVYFLAEEPASAPLNLRQSVVEKQVSSVVLGLAQVMLPGKLSLSDHGVVRALHGTVDARVALAFSRSPLVLSIDLDTTSQPEPEHGTL
ncbi:MAG TPA: hypothetical protein VMM92_04050, partial [Thermoanaerobaculia bacterium]|nr:hypothetical protein [Thermoanaerobaculia bacterium]